MMIFEPHQEEDVGVGRCSSRCLGRSYGAGLGGTRGLTSRQFGT